MATFEFTDAQVRTLKRAVRHELNDNSYLMGTIAKNATTAQALAYERDVLAEIKDILNRRQAPSVDKVAGNAVRMKEHS